MPVDRLTILQQEAHTLGVTWRKSVNYFNTFTTQWAELKHRFDSGEFDDRRGELRFGGSTFDAWTAEIGLPTAFVTKLLKAHELALADEHRQIINLDIERKKRERLAARNKPKPQRPSNTKSATAGVAKHKAQAAAIAAKKKEKLAEKRRRLSTRGPLHPELQALLKATIHLRQLNPADPLQLGQCYCMIRSRLETPAITKVEGKDEEERAMTWNKWLLLYIDENPDPLIRHDRHKVEQLIAKYIKSLPPSRRPEFLTVDASRQGANRINDTPQAKAAARLVVDEGKTFDEAQRLTGVGNTPLRVAVGSYRTEKKVHAQYAELAIKLAEAGIPLPDIRSA